MWPLAEDTFILVIECFFSARPSDTVNRWCLHTFLWSPANCW